MNFQSDFFKTLAVKRWWWVIEPFEKNNSDAIKQKYEFDNIAYAIEISSDNNKRILHAKLQKIIDHINPLRTSSTLSSGLQPMSLGEFCKSNPKEKQNLEDYYAEDTNSVAIFSEIKVFDELTKLGLHEIQFIEEDPQRKTPDLKAIDNNQSIFVEVKFISPPKEEEQGMIARCDEHVEMYQDWYSRVQKKLLFDLKDAKEKFEAVGAYKANCQRWVYVYIVWGSDAKLSKKNVVEPSEMDLFDKATLENKFGIELRFLKTF
ncbi:MAG: hypothetical protein ABH865_09615 [Candidatus Omnitrophota bacterium]|nr:hypothetical protein [Candidatus Omnitrophota bacterium]